jgi:hypothetical protein
MVPVEGRSTLECVKLGVIVWFIVIPILKVRDTRG